MPMNPCNCFRLWVPHLEDGINLLLPWFETSWGKLVAKPICLLNSPLTFEGVDGEAVVLQFYQDHVE